jgi:predicted histidine transporter YuiF (NhaC family)
MQILKMKRHLKSFEERWVDGAVTFVKTVLLLIEPLPSAYGAVYFWRHVLYDNDIHLSEKAEGIATAAWIPTFGFLYSLLLALLITTVWTEYKSIRTAVKKYDFEWLTIDVRDWRERRCRQTREEFENSVVKGLTLVSKGGGR